jgi:hypothetical protein
VVRNIARSLVVLVCALAVSACVTRSGGLTAAQIATLQIREIKFENGIAAPNDAMFRSASEILRVKLVERLEGRYNPAAKDGHQLTILITEARWPAAEGGRSGLEDASLKGTARLTAPGASAPLATYDVTSVEASMASGAVGGGGLVIGLLVSAVAANLVKVDFRDRVATRAANGLVQSMLSV